MNMIPICRVISDLEISEIGRCKRSPSSVSSRSVFGRSIWVFSGCSIAKARIHTKYRTRKSRARSDLQKGREWNQLSITEQQNIEQAMIKELAAKEEEELQAAAKVQIVDICREQDIRDSTQDEEESEADTEFEEQHGIQDDDTE